MKNFKPVGALLLLLGNGALAAPALLDEKDYFASEEAFLESFDLNAPDTSLSLLGALEGTSMILKVKDAEGRKVGVFKPTSGNTLHPAEIIAYNLCRRLKLPVCAPTVEKTIGPEQLDRFAELLENIDFEPNGGERHEGHYAAKERFRKAMLERLAAIDSLDGAFKSWINPLVLYQPLGTLADVRKHELYPYLFHDGPSDGGKPIELRQCTQIYKPAGCYRAELAARDLLEQFTGMLVVDALIGDNDRFAGGNVHLFSLDGRIDPDDGWHRLPAPSLLMLDNGAGFMNRPGRALRIITHDLKITRFPRTLYEGLLALKLEYTADKEKVLTTLGIPRKVRHAGRTLRPAKIFDRNLKGLLRYMKSLDDTYGGDAFY